MRDILKKEFEKQVIWFYNDLYNFIYNLKDSEKKEFESENFLQLLNQIKEGDNDFIYHVQSCRKVLPDFVLCYDIHCFALFIP